MQKKFQLLHSLITLEADFDSVRNEFEFASQDARQYFSNRNETKIRVCARGGGYRLEMGRRSLRTAKNPWELGYALLGMVHKRAFHDYGDCIRVHAACADYRDSRLIFIGQKSAGKTSLMMRLLFGQEGFQVSGDELVLIEGEQAIPFPRRFHIKTGSLRLLPAFKPYLENAPRFRIKPNSWLYGFSPAEAGFAWEIKSKKIGAIVHLMPHHDKESKIKEISGLEMVRRLLPLSYGPVANDTVRIKRLCGLVSQVPSFELQLGNLDKASDIIQNKLNGPNQ